MAKSIRISEKHGVNPTIPLCFWCGKEKNEVVLLGKLPGDAEAPMKTWLNGDYEPCDECKAQWEKGVVVIEVSSDPVIENQVAFRENVYPTGRVIEFSDNGVRSMFEKQTADSLIEHRKGFVDKEAFVKMEQIIDQSKEKEN